MTFRQSARKPLNAPLYSSFHLIKKTCLVQRNPRYKRCGMPKQWATDLASFGCVALGQLNHFCTCFMFSAFNWHFIPTNQGPTGKKCRLRRDKYNGDLSLNPSPNEHPLFVMENEGCHCQLNSPELRSSFFRQEERMDYLQKAAADCEFFKPAAIQDFRCVLVWVCCRFITTFFKNWIFVTNQTIKKNIFIFLGGKDQKCLKFVSNLFQLRRTI